MQAHSADVRLFLGKSTSGKSYLARYQMRAFPRQLIFDPNMEIDHGSGAVLCDDPAHLVELVGERGPIKICWRGFASMPVLDAFEHANACAWAGENFVVFWDEVERYLPAGNVMPEWAAKLINAGRHRGCKIFAATRRPARISTDLRDAATRICIGRITGDNSIGYLKNLIGTDALRAPGLQPREFLDWSEETETVIRKKSPFP